MKKVIASLCALSMVAAMGVTAFAADGDDNIALGKTGFASYEVKDTTGPEGVLTLDKMLDGDTKTRYGMEGMPDANSDGTYTEATYIGVNLGATAKITSLELYWETSRPALYSEGGYTVEVSTDNSTWTEVTGIEAANDTVKNGQKNDKGEDVLVDHETLTFDEVEAQYVRLNLKKGKQYGEEYKTNPSIYEFEIHGTMTGTTQPGDGDQTGDNNQDGGNTQTPDTGVEFPMAIALVAVAAGACVMMTKKAKAR